MHPRPLTKEAILFAMTKTKSNRSAARMLGVSYRHYKKYAKLYKDENGEMLFTKHLNPHGKGIPKFLNKKSQVGSILDVIEGRFPVEHYTPQKIRDKLIIEGYLIEECYHCKFHERRVSDYKIPLILNWKDSNRKNFQLDNIELVCYNCYFLRVGNIFSEKQTIHLEDYIPTPKSSQINWADLDNDFENHFRQLGIIEKKVEDKNDGSEFISNLKK